MGDGKMRQRLKLFKAIQVIELKEVRRVKRLGYSLNRLRSGFLRRLSKLSCKPCAKGIIKEHYIRLSCVHGRKIFTFWAYSHGRKCRVLAVVSRAELVLYARVSYNA